MPPDELEHVRVDRLPSDYRPLPPAKPAQQDQPAMAPTPPRAPPSLGDRVDDIFERRGLRDVGVADRFKRFALLPDRDQRELLQQASGSEFGRYLAHPRPMVRKRIIEERGQKVPGQGV
jgi:hypothetical protein